MAVKIRLSRFGRLHRPYFRIVAIDGRCHREGTANEILGSYDPLKPDKNIEVQMDRVEAWVKQGAQISTSLKNLFKHFGYQVPTSSQPAAKPAAKKPAAKKPAAKQAKKTYVAPTRRALRKHEATLKAARKAETAAKAAAAKPAEAAAEEPKA
jgi:small subunit ribosomal protein S16